MYRILEKEKLNGAVTKLVIEAPYIARRALAGQFVILRVDERGERIPLTVAGYDREKGSVTIIFQAVGGTTEQLSHKNVGETIEDIVGPLGRATEIEGVKRACVVGGGVGCAIALPVAQALKEAGAEVTSIIGFRNADAVILGKEFAACSDECVLMTDDGSYGEKGNVCVPLKRMLAEGKAFDRVFTIGPLVMMKFVCEETRPYGIPTVASMNPIMIDGTGMCGGCRLTVGGKTKFACVDGPEFDGHLIDFDEAMMRLESYREFEEREREKTCNLFKGAEK